MRIESRNTWTPGGHTSVQSRRGVCVTDGAGAASAGGSRRRMCSGSCDCTTCKVHSGGISFTAACPAATHASSLPWEPGV